MGKAKTLNNVVINMTLKSTQTRARLSTSSEDLAVQMGKINKWYDSLVPTGGASGNILEWDSDGVAKWVAPSFLDEKVKSTLLAQSTAEGSYRPTFVTGAGTGGVNIIDSFKVNHTPGTTSDVGNTRLILGNAIASGTANNEEGQLRLYSSGTSFHTLKGTTVSGEVIHVLPSTGGTILNHVTTTYTQTSSSSATGAYEIGKIKINGTPITIYGHDENTTYTASDGIKIESNVIKHTNSIASAASVFKKISYDAQGHITGTANVTKSDIPALDYIPTSMLTVTKNTDVGITPSSNVFGYVSGLTAAAWNFQQTDGTLFSQYYNDKWQTEIYMDYRTGQMSTRGKNNGTWQDWRIHLDSGNYTSYTVTKTGGGASGTWDINISGSAAKLGTANKGSATKGIYLSSGTPQEMTYSLGSTVNSGTANKLAYYNGANTISPTPQVGYYEINSTAATPVSRKILDIRGAGVGNTAAELISGTAGLLTYGDGGPQINFGTTATMSTSGAQEGALIFTDHDSAAAGVSWHFVSNQTDWNVISKRFHAKTSISIGTDKPSTSYNLTVNGTSYFNNTITIKGTSSGNASIYYTSYGNTRNATSIRFYDGDGNGHGVQVGGGGLTVLGGGESAQAVFDNLSTLGWSVSSEVAIVASDGPIYFMTNCDTFANRKSINIDTSGYLNTGYINMNVGDQDNLFTTASSIIYSTSDKYLRRVSLTTLGSTLGPYVGPYVTNVSDGSVIHQTNYNSAGGTRPVHRFIRSLRTNKLAFTLPANITIEYSTNAGSSWTSFGYTDAEKAGPFLSRHVGGVIAIGPASSAERTTSMQTRITITNDGRDCMIDQFYIWMSTSGHGTTVDIQYTTQSAKTTWVNWRTGVGLAGWAGPNVINVSELRYGNTIYSIRFIFKITSVSADYKTSRGTIHDIQAYGSMACWTDKNNMMKHDSLFTWDYEQKATFPAEIKVPMQLRVYNGNYGTILRSDGSDTYILLTDSGSAESGGWNNLRPFQISNSTGMVYLKQGAQVSSSSYGALSVIRAGSTNSAGIKFYNNGSTYLGSLALGTANGRFVRFKTDETTSYTIIDTSLLNVTETTNLGLDGGTNAFGYVSGLTKAAWNFQQTDGTIMRQYYNASWKTEIFMDYRTGQMSSRGKNNGTWQDWRIHLDSSNYTSYTVTKTGTGASGTWGISITGNAATATTASKLGTSTVGSGSRPIYLNAGTATQCDTPTSGAYWTGVPYVGSNGVMEIGKYIDFHGTNASTNDYDYRITAETQTLYFAPKSSGDATYNLIRMQSPDYNQIQFQTTKSGKAYTSTGIVAYPLTTSGQTMLIQSDGNTVVGGGESPRTLYSNSYDNMDTAENETLYLASDSSEIHFITNCQSYSGRKVLKVQDAQLVKSGGLWIYARDNAPVYANKPNAQDGGYYPAWFAKTKSGGWSMGVLSAQDNLYITYTTDTDYSGGNNNNTYTIQFQNKSGTVALTSDIPAADDHKVTQNNLTSGGTFPVILGGNSSAATVTDYVNKKYDALRLGVAIGTTSTDGYGELLVGNATASGTAGNAYGQISIYSSNTAGAVLRASSTTSWRAFYFPGDKGGTLAVTTDLAAYLPLAGGTMSGNITFGSSVGIIQTQNSGSNYTTTIKWWTGGTDPGTYGPEIGQWNTGGDSTYPGRIIIMPYHKSYSSGSGPWSNNAGLCIEYNHVYIDGTELSKVGHTHSLSIAADSGTNQLTMYANTKYKITAGGSTYIFTTPPNANYLSNQRDVGITYGANKLEWYDLSANNGTDITKKQNPTNDWYHHITMHHANSNGYFVDIAACFHSNNIYYRRVANGADASGGWIRLIDSSNIGYITLNATTVNTTAGSFVFGGDALLGGVNDWAGIQVEGINDRFQLLINGHLMVRQNDDATVSAAGWTAWTSCLRPADVSGSGGITVTQNNVTIGSGSTATTYKGTVTISHSNSITASTSTVFKKFSYDANGHITGTAAVAASDLPSHTHSQYYDSTLSRTANTVLAAPNGSNGAATFRKLVAADIPDLSGTYLPLAGGTMSGTITHPANTVAINLRNDNTLAWQNTIMTQSAGDEAVVFANANARTSWMFVNGEDSIAHPESNRWQSLTPALQIKGGCVAIGKLIPSGTTPTIKLDIAGSTALTGDIQLKTSGSSSDDSGDIVWYYGNGKEKMRIWTDNTYTAAKGPNYRVYKSDATLLYNGNLPLADGTGASGTWGISITGNAATATTATQISTQAGTANAARVVFFADSASTQKVVYDTAFTYNPSGGILKLKTINLTATTGISYTGTKVEKTMISFKDNTTDTSGNGIVIGGGGLTIIGGGESASTVASQYSSGASEDMYVANDANVYITTNLDGGWANRKTFTFNTSGDFSGARYIYSSYLNQSSGVENGSFTTSCNFMYNLSTDGFLRKVSASTVGSVMSPILTPYEANLVWGGKNFAGSNGPLDAALCGKLGANRLELMKDPDPTATVNYGILIRRQTSGGSDWTSDLSYSHATKRELLSSLTRWIPISATSTAGMNENAAKNRMRVELDFYDGGVYTQLNKFMINISSGGCSGCYVILTILSETDYENQDYNNAKVWNNNTKTWETPSGGAVSNFDYPASRIPLVGDSGWNVINIGTFTTYGNSSQKSGQYRKMTLTFGCTSNPSNRSGMQVGNILAFGGFGWGTPSNLAATGHIYTYDGNETMILPNNQGGLLINTSSTSYLRLKGATAGSVVYGKANPKIRFENADSSQNIDLIFDDYDSYQSPSSLTLIGNQGGEYFIAPNIKATSGITAPYIIATTKFRGAFGQKTNDNRQTTANLTCQGSASMQMILATSSMTTGKPKGGDGYILDFDWDNTGQWKAQLAIPDTGNGCMSWRGQAGSSTWSDVMSEWRTIVDSHQRYNNTTGTTEYNLTNAASYDFLLITTKPSSSYFAEMTTLVPAPKSSGTYKTFVNWPGNIAEASSQPTRTMGGYIKITYTDANTCKISCILADYYLQAGSSVTSGSTSGFTVNIKRVIGMHA